MPRLVVAVLLCALGVVALAGVRTGAAGPVAAEPGTVLDAFSDVGGSKLGMSTGVALTSTGIVLVADFLRLVACHANGSLLWTFQSKSEGGDVTVDASDVAYFASAGPVFVFDSSTGAQLRAPVPVSVNGFSGFNVIRVKDGLWYGGIETESRASGDILAVVNATDGSNVRHWQLPQTLISGIAIDSRGDIFAVDEQGDNLYYVDVAGAAAPLVISPVGLLYIPVGLAIDSQDRLYVADMYHTRVLVLQRAWVGANVSIAASWNVSAYPFAVAVGANGNVAVTITGQQPNSVQLLQGLPSQTGRVALPTVAAVRRPDSEQRPAVASE